MAPDIRNFFSGKSAASQEKAAPAKPMEPKKTRGKRKILEDSDDEDETPPRKATPQAPPQKKREPTPQAEETTTSEFFGKSKPKRSAPVRTSAATAKKAAQTPQASPAKSKSTPKSANGPAPTASTPASTRSTRRKTAVNYNENKNDIKIFEDDFDGGDDDVFADDFKTTGKRQGDDYQEDNGSDSEEDVKPTRQSREKLRDNKKNAQDDLERADAVDSDGKDDFEEPAKPVKAPANSAKKRKSVELEEDDDSDEEEEMKKNAKKSTSKKPPAKKTTPRQTPKKAKKQDDVPESPRVQAIFDSITLVRPPSPPAESEDKKPYKFGGPHANSGPPPAQGSKEIPVGAENCLAGLSFVFTGLLDTIPREEGQNLVKRYGGKVTGAPSSKTSYVVMGSDAGPSKLKKIKDLGIKTINEDGLFQLISRLPANGGDSKAAAVFEQKQNAEMEKIKQMAAEEEEAERKAMAARSPAKKQGQAQASNASSSAGKTTDNRLWTVKYAPTQMSHICGNKQQIERLQRWLHDFPKNQRTNFKKAGPDGSGTFRAVIIFGPPGIGKTTAAHLVAKLEGYDIVESNASDTRSKKLVETSLKGVLDTTSLLGYFAADGEKVEASKKKLCLIMDEVDGMSAGDRGGVGALAAVCKKTTIPMILICNDRKLPKMKPFDFVTFGLQFRRPTTDQIASRIRSIAFREKMQLPKTVIEALIEGSGADIRQVVNMISTAKMDEEVVGQSLDFDGGKQMSKAWQKHIILKPWDIVSKILGGGLFARSSKATLNDKIELYFNDHEWSALMLQENYLGTRPIRANDYSGKLHNLKCLELSEQAANSISEGDLVDRMIHGTQQHWSLMPTHAVMSFVRPASFVSGTQAGHQTSFTSWLGQNSSQGKLSRMVKEIQGHMRLRASGDRHEVRQQYIPLLWALLVKRLAEEGKEAVPKIIDLMDSYYLTKDDWDAVVELGVGPMKMKEGGNGIESSAKATFTRLYNQQSHPLPYIKASNVAAPKQATKEKPDLEEAIDESDGAEVLEEDVKEEEDEDVGGDITKDKYVKQPKKKKAAANGKAKKAAAQNEDDGDEDDESEDAGKRKKGKGKAANTKAKGKGKGKGKA